MKSFYKLTFSLEDVGEEDGKQYIFYASERDAREQIHLNSIFLIFPINEEDYNYDAFRETRKVSDVMLRYFTGNKVFTWRRSKGMRIVNPDLRNKGKVGIVIHATGKCGWTCYVENRTGGPQ